MTISPEQLQAWKLLADEATMVSSDRPELFEIIEAVPALIDEVERLQSDLEFSNDVIKERESWAAMRLQTCKKLENENDRLRKQLEKMREQRNEELEDNCYEPERPFEQARNRMDAELEKIK
jgi:predicted nuclease with TOPRIM domain